LADKAPAFVVVDLNNVSADAAKIRVNPASAFAGS
jgi:hypothetical protein